MMKKIEFECEIITPLVMGGAEMQPELRTQSFKGILRWWFRFYKGGSLDLNKLEEEESKIWGSQELSSRVKIVIKNKILQYGEAYLCMNDKRKKDGKSVLKSYDKIKRKAFVEGCFTTQFSILYPSAISDIEKEFKNTLFFLSNFGGLGARWRRGFGSVIIKEFQVDGNNIEELGENLKQKFNDFQIGQSISEFMNLSNTLIYLISPKNNSWTTWEIAMDQLRDELYRDLKKKLSLDEIAIGNERRVSPLIIQIKKNKNNAYYGVLLIWEKWEKWEDTKSRNQIIKTLQNFEIKEVKA